MKTLNKIASYIFVIILTVILTCALNIYLLQERIDNIAKTNPSVMHEDLIEEM